MLAAKWALALIGFSAVIGQIVLMRELIVVFNGNEISLGIVLATWLLWTAVGSSLSGHLVPRGRNARRVTAVFECLLGVSLLPTIWVVRASKAFFQTVPGELLGAIPMLLTSLVSLSLYCVLIGALFVVAARMYEAECVVSARMAASSAYLFEAAGSALGGVLAGFVLLRFLDSFQIATIVGLLNLCMAAIILFSMKHKHLLILAMPAALCAIVLLIFVAPRIERAAQARLWRGFHLLSSRDSIYGNLAVIETGNMRSIYDNGVILANAPDENAAEEAVHYALLEHPAPRHLLLIGGGVNGSIAQALKHPTIERIDFVELDPALIEMTRRFFPVQITPIAADSRVHLHSADGRYYLKTAGRTFDAIILDVPDPQTAQLNRFYTAEFFRSARDHLAEGGLLALQLRSSEENISSDLAEYLRCIHHTLKEVFPYVVVIPGETIHFIAATRPDVLTDDPQMLISRLRERKLNTQYVREYFIPFRMMPDRMSQVREQLRPRASTPVNRDFTPVAYYFNVALWSAQFKSGYSNWFRAAAHLRFTDVLAATLIVLLLVMAISLLVRGRERRVRSAAACCMTATGFTLITLQILLLLAFQSLYGYVYYQLTILIGLGMAGMALGSWLAMRRIDRNHDSVCRILAMTQFLLALSAPVLIFTVSLLAMCSDRMTTWLVAQCVFPALAALGGMLGGYQFPIATAIYLPMRDDQSPMGMLYALDLLGGCAGALLLSSYLIPVFGFWKTAWLCAAINLIPVLLAVLLSFPSFAKNAKDGAPSLC